MNVSHMQCTKAIKELHEQLQQHPKKIGNNYKLFPLSVKFHWR